MVGIRKLPERFLLSQHKRRRRALLNEGRRDAAQHPARQTSFAVATEHDQVDVAALYSGKNLIGRQTELHIGRRGDLAQQRRGCNLLKIGCRLFFLLLDRCFRDQRRRRETSGVIGWQGLDPQQVHRSV